MALLLRCRYAITGHDTDSSHIPSNDINPFCGRREWAQNQVDPFKHVKPGILEYDPVAPMHFFLNRITGGSQAPDDYWIAAEGIITAETPQAFLKFLNEDPFYLQEKERHDPQSRFHILYLHSCGGDEKAAMELGRIFQRQKWEIRIAQTYLPQGTELNEPALMKGECRNACILAAIGGSPFSREDIDQVSKIDLGHGLTKYNEEYIPIQLQPFNSPPKEIEDYAKEKGVDWHLLSRLLPQGSRKIRELNLKDTWRLEIGLIPQSMPKNISAEVTKPLPLKSVRL